MPDTTQGKGVSEQDLENKAHESLEKALGEKRQEVSPEPQQETNEGKQQQQTQQPEQTQTQQQSQQSTEDQDADLSKYDNVLKNTYGFDESEITDKDRKLAKSWTELQSKATKTQQEKREAEQQLNQLNQLLQNNPDLYEHAKAVREGRSYENPQQTGADHNGQPNQQQGQLDNTESVSEEQLISEGYLNRDQLQGMDDLDRRLAIKEAKLDRKYDQKVNSFEQDLTQKEQNLRKQREQQQIEQYNKKVLTDGLDEFVRQTGFNLAEVDDETFEQIQRKAIYDRDPNDPRKVAEDAFPVAATRILQRKGYELNSTPQPTKQNGIEDTGKSINQRQETQNRNKSIDEQLSEEVRKDFMNSGLDPKAQYFKNN